MEWKINPETIVWTFGLIALAWVSLLGCIAAIGVKANERFLRQTMLYISWAGVLCGLSLLYFFHPRLWGKLPESLIVPGIPWFHVEDYRYEISLYITPLSAWFLTLTSFLFAAIASFSGNYLHRDAGYLRFFLLVALAQLGVLFANFSNSGDHFFFGWELVGLSSTLLINFFRNHENAARQSLIAMVNYRVADAFLILALLFWHGLQGSANFFPVNEMPPESIHLWWLTGLCFIIGSLGKAGQFPFASWLPRAMEGPTPSSALFYGALSVHLGPYLLLRTYSIWSPFLSLKIILFGIGAFTALYSTVVGRTQANVKGQLGYAVMGQIGLILCELAFGLRLLACIHLSGHALLRIWQYLRASAFIQDLNENRHLFEWFRQARFQYPEGFLPGKVERKLYTLAVQGFRWDSVQYRLIAFPFIFLSNILNKILSRHSEVKQ